MHDAGALIAGGSVQAASAIAAGRVTRAVNIAGGMHHAMPDRASGFCVYNDAALAIAELLRLGRRAGRLRRCRRPPRRRCAGRVLRRPAGAHGLAARVAADPVPRHRRRRRDRSRRRGRHRGERRAAGRHRRRGLATGLPRGGSRCAAGVPARGPGHPARCGRTRRGSAGRTSGSRSTASAPRSWRCASWPDELTGGRWLALGGGGYAWSGWSRGPGPICWQRFSTGTSTRDTPLPHGVPAARGQLSARRRVAARRSAADDGRRRGRPSISRGTAHRDTSLDRAILDTRNAIFPLHGLDPFDPRD